jgi:5-methylcytosine-specific restriction endonuclease McrA
MPEIYEWLRPIWGNSKAHVFSAPSHNQPIISKDLRAKDRMPSGNWKAAIHQRDGYNCRFCGMPVIRKEVRERINSSYPNAARWGGKDVEHHTALQAMWAQYDHVVPHARGGASDLENIVLTCAACNFGRTESTLEEVNVADPRSRPPVRTMWDGLERFQ